MPKEKFYITTPIYYVNDRMHLGHAYTTVAADVLARYHRLKGEKVFFLTGTDEHGGKIEETAKELKKSPQQLCDENSQNFKEGWEKLNISYDNFIRTTDASHKKAVTKAIEILHKKGLIYKGIYKGLYCLGCEQYKTKSDLVAGKCPEHKTVPEVMEEESYLFKLFEFEKELKKKIKDDELKIRPQERKREVLEFLKRGLRTISVSREKVKWGIPLPFDKKLTAYVWIDALLNYLTGIGWDGDPEKLPEFWPPNVQLMAKDIIRVHATIWPAILLGLGISLPKQLFVHGYFTIEGQKMSKSLGNVIWPEQLIEKFGADATRYLLLSLCPFGRDGDISWKKLEEKYNADLAKGLGNLVSRVISLSDKLGVQQAAVPNNVGMAFGDSSSAKKRYQKALGNFQFNEALIAIWEIIGNFDRYIEREKPWEGGKRAKQVIVNSLYGLKEIAVLLKPFLPQTSEKILKQIETRKSEPLFSRL